MDRRILVIDDRDESRHVLADMIRKWAPKVDQARTATEGLERLTENDYAIVVTGVQLADMSVLDLIQILRDKKISTKVLVITDLRDANQAARAVKQGAFEYLIKPVDQKRLELVVTQALGNQTQFENLIGQSSAMTGIFGLVNRFAPWSCPILIGGPSGSGKELVAQAIHRASGRIGRLVTVNCAALSDSLFESELFGHEKGAFTGADRQRIGRFELASGGSLFLDEIGELKFEMQAKLLRVLQNGIFERVGGSQSIQVNTRVISATNCDLKEMVRQGSFREDLYFRLKGAKIELPALQDRIEDIPLLVNHFLLQLQNEGQPAKIFSQKALAHLKNHSWPGNVRELENLVARVSYSTSATCIDLDQLCQEWTPDFQGPNALGQGWDRDDASLLDFNHERPIHEITEELTERVERVYLTKVLSKYRGRIQECADHCGLSRRSISEKLRRYQIDKAEFKPMTSRRRA